MRTRAAVLVSLAAALDAQGPPHNGPRPVDPGWYALTNATVVTAPGQRREATTVVVRGGLIAAVGGDAPAGATVIDCAGLTIYPGLVEPFLTVDVPALEPDRRDAHWNAMVQPQRRGIDGTGIPAKEREQLRALGFTAAAIVPGGGILAGASSVVLVDEPAETESAAVLRPTAYALAALARNRNGYPNSETGAIALLRQMLHDAAWYERAQATVARDPGLQNRGPALSAALQALVDQQELPLWFDTRNELQALRVIRIAEEVGRRAVVVGSGMEFRRLAALAAAKVPVVVPLDYPAPPELDTAAAAEAVSLRQLQSWEQAPTNSKRLLDAGVTIAWTTARLEDRKEFRQRMHEAMQCGIDEATALAALTTVPATLLGVDARLGTIEPGKLANLAVVDGSLFDPKAKVREVWVGGRRHDLRTDPDAGLDGTWTLQGWPDAAATDAPTLAIDEKKVKLTVGGKEVKVAFGARDAVAVAFRAMDAFGKGSGVVWLRAHHEGGRLVGTGTRADGSTFAFRGEATPAAPADDGRKAEEPAFEPPALTALPTPLGGYGLDATPRQQTFVVVGATVWPCDGRAPIPNGAVLVRDGRIVFAGPAADMPPLPPDTITVEAHDKHVTPGLLDCHSHTGISGGVNESGEAVTAEVRIEDVIDPDDVNWYRQLAGGVTAVNQLHGSANAIGGQSSTVKVRWGVLHPDEMRLAGAPPGIKFALGENPRRANSREPSQRYPGTRMGVEALIRDRFVAAAAYAREHAAYRALSPRERAAVLPPRRDLELEAVAEILASERRIHCHSYRQDEIFMLCNLAREFGIRIGTFQHVLEGYKVADAIAANAVGASSFSDWWGYKFEVYDAIPENGAILHEVGVSVSFNSDSDEHARRLNTEAGKAVKYGGVAPAEALCFVTRNPAVQLGIFDRTGSLTAGKDADVALWTGPPLSYAARCEATWVDGRLLFSLERDRRLREGIAAERQRLLQKAAAAAKRKGDGARGGRGDAYWDAEYLDAAYCCREHDGGRR